MKHILLTSLFLLTLLTSSYSRELNYVDAKSLTLIGKALPTGPHYHRIDTTQYPLMPLAVKRLFTQSAGLAVVFKTNSTTIAAKWTLGGAKALNNMTPIGQKGLDLYIKRDGVWEFAGVGRPSGVSSTYTLVEEMGEGEKECLLYLPLYDELKSLEIGVDAESSLESLPSPFKGKVLIYGSSITQGASASRPGMAYPSILSRRTGIHFVNLGLSGNGKMETAVADMLADHAADAYILDCAANPSPEQITERTAYLVRTLRERHPEVPIIMIQSVVREGGNFNLKIKEREYQKNVCFKAEYEKLLQEGIRELYLIEGGELLGQDHEGTTDGTHPNDVGFERMLRVIEPGVMAVLRERFGL